MKMMPKQDRKTLPKAEPHCNCTYCQITRTLSHAQQEEEQDEEVTEEDLRFRSWDIEQKGDQLFTVTNPLDKAETYQVFLGHPVGCTCGKKKCAHIEAVLRS